jgi:glutaredoxin
MVYLHITRKLINESIMSYLIYSKGIECNACVKAKKTLIENNIVFKEILIDSVFPKEKMVELVFKKTGNIVNTVPQIFMTNNNYESYIGGYTDLVKHLLSQQKNDYNEFQL